MKKILSTALAIVLFVGASQAQTQEDKHKHGGNRGEMFKELNLSTDQQAKLKTIREAEKGEMQALKADGKTDADKAARKAIHEKYKTQIESVLTAEQKAKLKEGRKEGRGEGFDKTGRNEGRDRMKEFGKNLDLSADQQTKVASINSDFRSKMEVLRSNTALSQEAKREQFKQLAQSHKTSLKAVLTQEQIAKMEAARKNFKGKRDKNL